MLWLSQKLFELLVLLLPVQLGRHFWPGFSYIQGLRVDYLSPTIYLTDILVISILGIWIIEKIKNQKSKVKNTIQNLKFLALPISFFIFLLVNSLFAQNSGATLYKFFKILEFSLLGFYVAKNQKILSIIHYPLSIAVIYSSLLAIAQFFKQSSLNGIFWFLGERTFNAGTPGIAKAVIAGRLLMRPYATFPHPNALAGFLLVGLILTLPFLFKKSKLLVASYLLLVTSAILLTFSRSVWLVGALILFLYLTKKFPKYSILNTLYLILFLVFAFRLPIGEAIWQRWELARAAIQMFKSHLFAGVGLNNFIVYLPDFWQPKNQILWLQPVHNIYLLVASETGLVGLVIFLWFLVLTYKKLLIINSELLIALSAILALGLFDHYWLTLQQNQLLLAIVLGLSWGIKKAKIQEDD